MRRRTWSCRTWTLLRWRRRRPLLDCVTARFEGAAPVRPFRWSRGERHFALVLVGDDRVTRRLWLEQDRLLLMDFDRRWGSPSSCSGRTGTTTSGNVCTLWCPVAVALPASPRRGDDLLPAVHERGHDDVHGPADHSQDGYTCAPPATGRWTPAGSARTRLRARGRGRGAEAVRVRRSTRLAGCHPGDAPSSTRSVGGMARPVPVG